MLRSISSVPMSTSSPSKLDTIQKSNDDLISNFAKQQQEKSNNNKRKKHVSSSDEDDEDYIVKNTNLSQEENDSHLDLNDEEKDLENLVFGSEKFIVENIEKVNSKYDSFKQFVAGESTKTKKTELADHFQIEKPAWQDDNEEEISGQDRLNSKFTKYFGTPKWADLDTKKKKSKKQKSLFKINKKGLDSVESENETTDDDEESDEMFQHTGNYLADTNKVNSTTSSLSKTNIDIKVCTDANKEDPHNARLKSVEFHPNARVMLTAGQNQKLTLFQIDGKKNSKIQSIFIEKFPIMTAHFTHQTGDEIIMGSTHNKYFYYYDMHAGKIMKTSPPVKALDETRHTKMSARFEISPDNRFIAFVGTQGQIHLFSVKSKEWIDSLKINDSCNAITFSPDSRYLFAFGDDKDVHIFDMNDRGHRSVHKFTDYGCLSGTSIAVSNNSQFIATGCKSGVVNIYNLNDSLLLKSNRNPKPIKSFMNLTTPCTQLKFNSTSEILSACSQYSENACKLIHIGSMSVFSNFPLHNQQIRIPQCIDFSLNSGYFTIGNHKGNALLYRLKHYGSF